MIIEGAIAVKAALNSKYRKIIRIYIDEAKHTSNCSRHPPRFEILHISKEFSCAERLTLLTDGKYCQSH